MREAAERRQQLELEHEQALAVLNAKQQEIDLLQKVRELGLLNTHSTFLFVQLMPVSWIRELFLGSPVRYIQSNKGKSKLKDCIIESTAKNSALYWL